MWVRSFCSLSLLLIIGLITNTADADPNLVVHYTFDDGTASDVSGNGHHGILFDDAGIVFDVERNSSVLSLDGDGDYLNCGGGKNPGDPLTWADILGPITIATWFKIDGYNCDWQCLMDKGNSIYRLYRNGGSGHGITFKTINLSNTHTYYRGTLDDGRWRHIAAVYDGTKKYIYIDGSLEVSEDAAGSLGDDFYDLVIGRRWAYPTDEWWRGYVDDFRLYSRALSAEEIRKLGDRHEYVAHNPRPVDEAVYAPVDTVLSWSSGDLAAQHDVYLGTDYDDVANAGYDSNEFVGTFDTNSYIPSFLASNTTYYWAVDEVNGPNIWTGEVWKFTTGTEGYYKDLFIDAGISLTDRKTLYAAEHLGLSVEYVTTATASIQYSVIVRNSNDDNGVLLYPDGEPRFRCLYVPGGGSVPHGVSLGQIGRERVRNFYYNGGCYVGTCAGSSIASISRSDYGPVTEEYFHIWPARVHFSGISSGCYLSHIVPGESPLLDYYDFGGDNYITDVYHNLGNYTIQGDDYYWADGTEALLICDCPDYSMNGNVSCWAYKEDADSGRLVVTGNHPEHKDSGEQLQLMAAMLRYAMDGAGSPNIKASLQNSVTRDMNYNDIPDHEKIGDRQYHHFTVEIPPGMSQLTITLDGNNAYDLDLFLRKGDFAFRSEPEVIEADNGPSANEIISIDNPTAGIWYIGVKCVSTVSTTTKSWGLEYTDNIGVLNGVAYTIKAEWIPAGDVSENGAVDYDNLIILADH